MKIAVTGATGFIARHLIPILKERYEVIAIIRDQQKADGCPWLSGISKVTMDVNHYPENAFLLMGKPDKLIHLAWDGLPNYQSPHHLVEGARQLLFLNTLLDAGLNDLTVTGTCFEYGFKEGKLSENEPTHPSNPYGVAKDSLRKALEFLTKNHNSTFRWIRLFYMFGEGQNENSLLPQLTRAIEKGEPVFNMSGGEQLRDYLPVEQVAEHIMRIVDQKEILGIINCCSGSAISVRELVENKIREKSAKISLNLGYYPYPDYEPMAFWGDTHKYNRIIQGNNR